MSILGPSAAVRRKPGVRPSFKASASAGFSGDVATGVTVTIPATASVGDFAIFAVSCRSDTRNVTAPGDLTKIYDTRDWPKSTNATGNATRDGLSVYTKRLEAGDPGSTRNFKATGTGSEVLIACVGTYSGVSHIACLPRGTTYYGGSYFGKTPYLTSMSMGKDNLLVGLFSARAALNLHEDNGKISSLDSNYTIRENESLRLNGLSPAVGLTLADAPTHGWLEETTVGHRITGDITWTNVMLELAGPDSKGWFENERWPQSLQGKPVYIYGTSNTCMCTRLTGLGAYPDEGKWTTQNSWPDWIRQVGDPDNLGNHMGIGGTHVSDNVTYAFGSNVNMTRAMKQDIGGIFDGAFSDVASIYQAGTWMAQTNRDMGGIVFLDIFGNDILWEETPTSQVRDGVAWGAETMVRLLRSKYVRGCDYTGTSTSGTWNNSTGSPANGFHDNKALRTTQPGATVTITTNEPHIDLLVIGRDCDNDNDIQDGAPFSISVDGVVVHTDTTHNRLRLGASSTLTPSYNFAQMAIPLEMGPGSHTVVLTHTGVGTEALYYQGYLVPKTVDAEIPWIVLMGMQWIHTDGIAGQAALPHYIPIMESIAAKFPDGKVLVYDPNASGQWGTGDFSRDYGPTGSGGAFTVDMIHMNNIGHAFFAIDLMRFLNERIP